MHGFAGLALGLLLTLPLTSCVRGIVFTHTVQPLTVNFNQTPVSQDPPARGSVKRIDYSFVRLRWDGNAIGQIARENGLASVQYADVEVIRVLGVFTQTYVRVYGARATTP